MRKPGRLTPVALFVFLLVWSRSKKRASPLAKLAFQVAADIPDDGEALAAIRAAGARPRDLKQAAAMFRDQGYAFDHRINRRAARLLEAVAGGGPLVTASAEEEALFRAVESIEALSIEDAFAVLAAEVPALRDLEQQVTTSRAMPGWEDNDPDHRIDEILASLDQLVGPQAPAGSLFIRSEVAHGYARVYLLSKADLIIEDATADPEEQADLLAVLARGYGVAPEVKRVATEVRKRVGDRDGSPTLAVMTHLLGEPGIGERLRQGDGPSDSAREAMTSLLATSSCASPAQFVDKVVEEVRSTLLRASGEVGAD
jgi:hypothetical protein